MATLYYSIAVFLPLCQPVRKEVNISKDLRSVPIYWTVINYNRADGKGSSTLRAEDFSPIPPNWGQRTLSIYAILPLKEGGVFMKGIGISLIVWGCIGILFGLQMFGDIGIACIWASVASILAGAGFLSVNKQIQNLWKQK